MDLHGESGWHGLLVSLVADLPVQFCTSSVVYLILSLAFPAKDSFVDKAVLPDDGQTTESSSVEVFVEENKESTIP
jgi:hypothetical protein